MSVEAISTFRVGIVADDLTSAMDGAGPFVARAAVERARVLITDHQAGGDADLVAIDVDSRGHSAREAGAVVARAVARVRHASVLFKTVDSTLRGHVRAELEAAWSASERSRVVFAPAYPAQGRTTVHGRQLVDGIEVAQTGFGADLRHPATTAAIDAILAPLTCALWSGGDRPLPDAPLLVADAVNDCDLDRVVELVDRPSDVLWVGSPGLAAALARHHGGHNQRPRRRSTPVRRLAIVIGSSHPVNDVQLSRLGKSLNGRMRLVEEVDEAQDCDVAVLGTVTPAGPVSDAAAERHRTRLAGRACALLHAGFDGLIVTGGETARAVISSLGDPELEVVDELGPGIVIATASCTPPVTVVTKAGGFGGPNTFVELYEQMTGVTI